MMNGKELREERKAERLVQENRRLWLRVDSCSAEEIRRSMLKKWEAFAPKSGVCCEKV